MGEIINPYIAGAPVTETKMFFGREDVFDWIRNSLVGKYADHILVIHGQRRVGKTSVLKQLGNRLPEKYISVFFDLQGRTHTNLDRLLWWLAREIVHVLKQERNIEIALPEKEAFALDAEYFENRFLPGLQPALGDHTLILTFDEFDNLEESEIKQSLARPLVDYLRRLMGRPGLNFIFSIGSSGRKLENMQAAYTEFFKTALYKKISFLSQEQTHLLITRPVEGVLEYEPAAVDRIYRIASGHPYFTQLTCHELFARCQRTGQRKIAQSDVDAILDDVVERGTVNLKFVWDEASDLEKWGLAALAHLEEKALPPAVAAFLNKQHLRFSESDLTSGLLHLREKDVITSDNRFVIYLLRLWLQKNRPIEQVREELTEVNPIANRYIEIGLEFRNAGTYDKAFESFQEALAVDPDNIQAQVNIGLVYMDQKFHAKAIIEFEKALTIDDEDVTARAGLCEAHLALGDAAMQKGRTREAVQSYQRVLAINAEHTEARGRMAEIQRLRAEKALSDGREDEAIAAFVEALKFTPEDEALVKRYEQALVERRTKMVAELLTKAEKEQSARNWDGAISILNQAEKIDPGNSTLHRQLEAVRSEQHQVQLSTILSRADKAEAAGRWKQVIGALNEYSLLEPSDEKVQKRLEAARKSDQVARLEVARGRGKSLARQERFEEAQAVWDEELRNNPEQRSAILVEVEKLTQAKIQAQTEQRKLQLGTVLARADRSEAAGRWSQVIPALEEYLLLEPVDVEVQKRLENAHQKQAEIQADEIRTRANSFARQEHFEEALAAWQELLKFAPDQATAIQTEIARLESAQALAKSYAEAQLAYSQKDYDQAVSLLKAIILKDENYKDASRLLSQAIELRRTRHKWWQNRWLWGMVGSGLLILVVWFGYQPARRIAASLLEPKFVPTYTEVSAVSTATVGKPAVSNGSTLAQTVTLRSAEDLQAFSQPIIGAIANLPPDYADDFSDPNSGWPFGTVATGPSGLGVGEQGYIEGEYFLRAPYLPTGQCCLDSYGGKPPPSFTNLVMTVDFRFMSTVKGSACIDSRRAYNTPDQPWINICFSTDGNYYINKLTASTGEPVVNGSVSKLKTGPDPNHLEIIDMGDLMAFFLNEEPIQLIQDEPVIPGLVVFSMESDTSTPLEVRFDNLKVWNLDALPLFQVTSTTSTGEIRAFADPILSAIADRQPDLKDDFSDPKSGWPVGSTSNGDKWGYSDGAYSLLLTDMYGNSSATDCQGLSPDNQPQYSDLVEQLDVELVSGMNGSWSAFFRSMQSNPQDHFNTSYFAGFTAGGMFFLDKNLNIIQPPIQVDIFDGPANPSFVKGIGKNRLTIIAKGTKMAVYVNGAPYVMANDPSWLGGNMFLNFGACNEIGNNSPLQVRFDNLKVWNITNLTP